MRAVFTQSASVLSRDEFALLCIDIHSGGYEIPGEIVILSFSDQKETASIKPNKENIRIRRLEGSRLIALSRNGEIEIFSNVATPLSNEYIFDHNGGKLFGFLNDLNIVDGRVYACGLRGQVYNRILSQQWELISETLITASVGENYFGHIDGRNQEDVYVVGPFGILYHYDGLRWTKLDSKTNVSLGEMVFSGHDRVFIAGSRGTMLVGNAMNGFEALQLSSADIDFATMCYFRDRIFIGTEKGLMSLNVDTLSMTGVESHSAGDDIVLLEVFEDVMWCFCSNSVSRYDGKSWEKFGFDCWTRPD